MTDPPDPRIGVVGTLEEDVDSPRISIRHEETAPATSASTDTCVDRIAWTAS
jgi:hypothetical protein